MIRGFPVLFVLLSTAITIPLEEQIPSDATVITEIFSETETVIPPPDGKDKKKDEKLEEEIYKIGQVMPETVVVQENADLRISDEMDLKKKLEENFSVAKFRILTTERSKIVGDSSIDSVGGLEPDDEGGEQARQTSEKELAELSERLRENKEDSRKDGKTEEEEDQGRKESEREEKEGQTDKKVEEKTEEEKDGKLEEPKEPEREEMRNEEDAEKKEELKKEATIADSIMPDDLMEGESKEEDTKPQLEGDRISWDLVHFLIMLTPTEEEFSWWTIIVEAVRCSLRSCSSARSHWHQNTVYLPRITRHRREDAEFELNQIQTTPKTCICQNLEAYFEKMYEKIGKTRANETRF